MKTFVLGLMLSEISAVQISKADSNLSGASSQSKYASMNESKLTSMAKEQTEAKAQGDPALEDAIASRIWDRVTGGGYAGAYGYYGGVYGYGWPSYYPGWSTTTVHHYDPYPAVWSYYPTDVVAEINTLKAYHDTVKSISGYVASETVKRVTDVVTDAYNKVADGQNQVANEDANNGKAKK